MEARVCAVRIPGRPQRLLKAPLALLDGLGRWTTPNEGPVHGLAGGDVVGGLGVPS
jgi:hypothetical protein